jgi:hypothetical protein
MERKSFLQAAAMGTLGILAPKLSRNMPEKNLFVHHVYFWLKNPDSKDDYNKLLEGLQALSKVTTIKMCHMGKPAGTNRDVIDRSYSVSWLLLFNNKEDQDKYQVDPIHLKFVEQYAQLWSKVIVYDSVDV